MRDYEINNSTLALISISAKKTKVYEKNNEYIVNKNANKIMENSCSYFGSSMVGRQKGTFSLIGITHKAPIIVEEEKSIIFFPTCSPRLNNCSWISLKNIKDYEEEDNGVVVQFTNSKKIKLDLSYGVVDNQVLRASRLESVLRSRKKSKNY